MPRGTLNSAQLIEAIKRRAAIPDAQTVFDDDTLLKFVNEEMDNSIVPFIMSMHQEYFTHSEDVLLIANQNEYEIPYRAIGNKLRDIKYKDTSNNYFPMTRIEPEDRAYFDTGVDGYYRSFIIQGDRILLVPGVNENPVGYLALVYFLRPNELVKLDRISNITAIDTTLGIISLDRIPEQFANGMLIDFNKNKSANRILSFDIPVLSVDTVSMTITIDPANIPMFLSVGDEVASAGECGIPQIPAELQSMLCERVAARVMAAQGDMEGLQASNAKIAEMEVKAGTMIDNRTEGNPQKINNINSLLRRSKIGRRRFFF